MLDGSCCYQGSLIVMGLKPFHLGAGWFGLLFVLNKLNRDYETAFCV